MNTFKSAAYTGLSAVLLVFSVSAQENGNADSVNHTRGEIELGIGYSSEDSFKFGEFSGLENAGPYFLGNIHYRRSSAYDAGTARYWEISGTDLGLDSRAVYGEYGQQGKYSVILEYDQIPHNRLDDARTPYNGAGTGNQTLPSEFISTSNNTSGMTNLSAVLKDAHIKTERRRFGGEVRWLLTEDWEIGADYRHEVKDGSETLGSLFGTNGGNPRSVVLAAPVEYEFDEFDVSFSHVGEKAQVMLSYHMSLFNNGESGGVVFDNPYNAVANWCPSCPGGVSPNSFAADGIGRMSLSPDNEAHRITINGAYNINPTTRMNANVSYGWMRQNEQFLPYSTFDGILATTRELPRDSLNGQIDTLFANVSLSTRLLRRLALRARVTYDDRANSTPRDVYLVVHNDVQAQSASSTSVDRRRNRPYSLEKLNFNLEAAYRMGMGSKLTGEYEYEDNERTFSEVESTTEHTVSLKLSASPLAFASGWVKFSRAVRYADDPYVANRPFLEGHDPDVITALAAISPKSLFENDPLLRKSYMADRDRTQAMATVNFYPFSTAALTMTGRHNKDDFEDTRIGLQESENASITFDISYYPADTVNAYGYVTYENYRYLQRGFARPGFPGPLTPTTDRLAVFGDGFWTMDNENNVYTLGTGFEWDVIEDLLDIKVDYTYSHANTEATPMSTGQDFLSLPKIRSRLQRLKLGGEYRIREDRGIRMTYLYERFRTTDFALDSVQVNTLANVILMGNSSPDYNAHVFGLTYFQHF